MKTTTSSMQVQLSMLVGSLEDCNQTFKDLKQSQKHTKRTLFRTLADQSVKLTDAQATIKKVKYKTYTDILDARDEVKYLATSISDLAAGVQEGTVGRKKFLLELGKLDKKLDQVLEVLTPYIAIASNEDDESQISKRDLQADIAAKKVAKTLKRLKAKYGTKIPKKLTSAIQIVEIPVMARFENLAVTKDLLETSGFDVQTAGLHSSPSSDLGFVFEPQPVIFFRITDAKEYAKQRVKNKIDSNSVIMHKKHIQKERSVERRLLKKLQSYAPTTKIEARIKASEALIEELTHSLDSMDAKLKQVGSVHRALKANKTTTNQAILDYLDPIVEALTQRAGQEMRLFTTHLMTGVMKDSDVVGAWLCTHVQLKLMLQRTAGDMKLKSWFLPW